MVCIESLDVGVGGGFGGGSLVRVGRERKEIGEGKGKETRTLRTNRVESR